MYFQVVLRVENFAGIKKVTGACSIKDLLSVSRPYAANGKSDYYKDFIKEKAGNTPETELTKPRKGENQASVSFVSKQTDANSETFPEDLLKNQAMKERFDFEVEERAAVMIFDGNCAVMLEGLNLPE